MFYSLSLLGLLITLECAICAPHQIRYARSPPGSQPKPIDALIHEAMKDDLPSGRAHSLTHGPRLVQMDMKLSDEQYEAIYGNKIEHKIGRIALGDESFRWTGAVIPYVINPVFDDKARKMIRDAMDEWERYTCISFVPRRNQENYVEIIRSSGCWSQVGMVGGLQQISLDIPGCLYHHTIIHELGHTVGRHHEQTRPDRDDHVVVHLGNVHADQRYNFDKYPSDYVRHFGVKYDYWSVMHYSQYAFTRNGRRTIETLVPEFQDVIGSVPGLSLKDIQTANFMYRCSEHCDKRKCHSKAILSEDCKCWCNTGRPGNPVVEWDGISECLGADDPTDTCIDYNDNCLRWSDEGQCETNTNYMLMNCRKACQVCGPDAVCRDFNTRCEYWGVTGECERNPGWMLQNCMMSCGVCGNKEGPSQGGCEDISPLCESIASDGGCEEYAESMLERCRKSCHVCTSDPEFECRNWHIECEIWKEFGRCNDEPEYMDRHCPKSCGRCSGGNVPNCKNYFKTDSQCETWAREGECASNPGWMFFHCTKACRVCGPDKLCKDRHDLCEEWTEAGYCTHEENRYTMAFYCPVSCKRCTPTGPVDPPNCANFDPLCEDWERQGWCDSDSNLMLPNCPKACQICGPDPVCKDYNDKCQQWTREGECDSNPSWMHVHCALSCDTCPEPTEGAAGGGDGDSCTPNPCNGGTCREDNGDITCSDCPSGFAGDRCQDDLCEPNPCRNMATCERTNRGYKCNCRQGYSGTNCENDECMPNPCQNGGQCQRRPNGIKCRCADGYRGNRCQVDLCANDACNLGKCVRLPNSYECNCPTGITGDSCDFDPCANKPCNGGTCTGTSTGYICTCPSGTSGDNCEEEVCEDYLSYGCDIYERMDWCNTSPSWMLPNCPRTCGICGPNAGCKNYHKSCDSWADYGECVKNPGYMLLFCRQACGSCNVGDGSGEVTNTPSQTTTRNPTPGRTTVVPPRDCNYPDTYYYNFCRQFLDDCAPRARRGECKDNPDLMLVNCPVDCGLCGENQKNVDYNDNCPAWAGTRQCDDSPLYMQVYCRKACNCLIG